MIKRSFSYFLSDFLKQRNLNAHSLSRLMNLSGSTAVLRILNDKSSVNTIISFASKLKAAVKLTQSEEKALNDAIEFEQLPKSVVDSRRLLTSIFKQDKHSSFNDLSCTMKNARHVTETEFLYKALDELINQNVDDDIEVYIENIDNDSLTDCLFSILDKHSGEKISVDHFFYETEDAPVSTIQLYSVLRLSSFNGYTPYFIDSSIFPSHRILVLNKTADRGSLFYFYDDKHYTQFEAIASENLVFDHALCEFSMLKGLSVAAKEHFSANIKNLDELFATYQKLDSATSYDIKQTPCFMLIPIEIKKQLFSNMIISENEDMNKLAQDLYNTIAGKENILERIENHKYFIYPIEGIKQLLKTGKTSDYPPLLPPLDKEQIVQLLLSHVNNELFHVYFMKENYKTESFECVLFGNNSLVLYGPAFGYWLGHAEIAIKNKRMLRIMRDFINEELIKSCCYSEEQTKEILRDMLNQL